MSSNVRKIKQIDSQGIVHFVDVNANLMWHKWDSADESAAPYDLGYDTIGFSTDGRMWDYTAYNNTWTVTTQTWTGFIGK